MAALVPFDHRLLRLMNDRFCQETPLLDVEVYDALPRAWDEEERGALPAANPDRRAAIGRKHRVPDLLRDLPGYS